jgi:hypothetical protein
MLNAFIYSAGTKLGFSVKIKEDDPALAGLTAGILVVFRGLKFESDADIGGKDSFRSGTTCLIYKIPLVPSWNPVSWCIRWEQFLP